MSSTDYDDLELSRHLRRSVHTITTQSLRVEAVVGTESDRRVVFACASDGRSRARVGTRVDGGHRSLDAWMQGPGAGLRKVPDIVLENFDGAQSFLLIDVKTFDAAGLTHVLTRHTDRVRLAAHRYVTKRAVEEEYGALPARMRLVVLPISTFGAIGTPGHTFIGELSRRMRASVPYSLLPHASWATPRVSPMIRMALTHAASVAASRRLCTPTAGGAETVMAVEAPSRAGGSFGAWLRSLAHRVPLIAVTSDRVGV